MTPVLLVHALVLGGSLLALWVYVRLGERRPNSLKLAFGHVIVACLALTLVPTMFGWVAGDGESARALAVGLFGVLLPVMTYTFVSALLLFEQLQRALHGR
jgi:hypothetical protein